MILFLNKKDLFLEKIAKVDLRSCFPEYDGKNWPFFLLFFFFFHTENSSKNYPGGHDYEKGVAFIQKKFTDLNENPKGKTIFTHITCATDTNHMRVVFNAVSIILLRIILDDVGI
jgi:hypothetical protein